MAFFLSYQTKGQTYYLTNNNGWIANDITRPNLRTFPSVKAGRNFYSNHHLTDARPAFANRKIAKLLFVDPISQQQYALDEQSRQHYFHHCGDKEMYLPTMNDFKDLIHDPNNHIMILDLEFFLNSNDNNDLYPRQIAGQCFNSFDHFNVHIFDPDNMNESRQLEYLQKSDLPFSVAKENTLANAKHQLIDFMKRNDINYVLSWDNHQDFYTLNTKVDPNLFKGITSVDLALLVSTVLSNSTKFLVSLKTFTNLLNLTHKGEWHDAADDVEAINKICQHYYNN